MATKTRKERRTLRRQLKQDADTIILEELTQPEEQAILRLGQHILALCEEVSLGSSPDDQVDALSDLVTACDDLSGLCNRELDEKA